MLETALALGAGAAKGYAHIGVIEVLEEQGIVIRAIAGSSMGAVVASAYAAVGSRPLHALARSISRSDVWRMVRPSLRPQGLLKTERIGLLLQKHFWREKQRFDQLHCPLAVVACCLETGRVEIFDHGQIKAPVMASMAVPGLFEPIMMSGKTYVDAGAMESVPVAAARRLSTAPVIAVDVGCSLQTVRRPRHMGAIFARYLEILQCSTVDCDTQEAAVVIHVPPSGVSGWDFSDPEPAIAAGRAAAQAAMPQIVQALLQGNEP